MKPLLFLGLVAFLVALSLSLSAYAYAEEKKNVTRIEFITYVMSGLGETQYNTPANFTDLPSDDRYFSYVSAAAEEHADGCPARFNICG